MRPHEVKELMRGQRLIYIPRGQRSEIVTVVRVDEEVRGPYVGIVVRDVEQKQFTATPAALEVLPGRAV